VPLAAPPAPHRCCSTLHVVIGIGIRNAYFEFFPAALDPGTGEPAPAKFRREEREDGSTGLGDTCSSLP
jgi:hypothetical protein